MEVETISERIVEAVLEERFLNKDSLKERISPIINIWTKNTEKAIVSKHKKEGDFIDRQVIKLQRKYTKDELVAHLNKRIAEKDFRIGELTSEVDELKHTISETKKKGQNKVYIEANKALRMDKLTQDRISKINKQQREIERLRKANSELIARINQK